MAAQRKVLDLQRHSIHTLSRQFLLLVEFALPSASQVMLFHARQSAKSLALLGSICLLSIIPAAQEIKSASPQRTTDDVVRITTELVQTDVMVFDKRGKFVDDLRADQFELRVDGKPQPISFFEKIRTGTINEEAQLAAARGGATRRGNESLGTVVPLDRSRTVFFFIDDVHLAPSSLTRVRETLLRFIDTRLGQNDQAAIVSATGQPGFLQQLTSEKVVLRAAVERIKPKSFGVRDGQQPPMSEAQAMAIERHDLSVLSFFVDAMRRDTPSMTQDTAESMVEQRARSIHSQSTFFTESLFLSLENLVRGCGPLPGRKVILFFSDGFLVDVTNGSTKERLQNVTDAAARSGVVIYSVGAQGLATGTRDASFSGPFDPRLTATDFAELSGTQAPLYVLASETGGRAILNTNALDASVDRALEETSVYYLLAWKPAALSSSPTKFRRIEASIKGRTDVTVMVRKGLFDAPRPELPVSPPRKEKKKEPSPTPTPASSTDRQLYEALTSRHPRSELPASLALGFVSTATHGSVLTASVGLDRDVLQQLTTDSKTGARVDVVGAIYNDKGDALSSFKQELLIQSGNAPPRGVGDGRHTALYSHTFRLTSGLYQVRIAALERESRRAGSASQWVEIPALDSGQFSMSSLFLGGRPSEVTENAPPSGTVESTVLLSVDRRFARDSTMRFVMYVYNAATRDSSSPDVALQVQVFRDDQPIFTEPLTKLRTVDVADLKRIPYAAELSLASFPAGRYLLQVTVIDRIARASANQRVNFTIE